MDKPYVVVVGGINVDICGKAWGPLLARDSNPGQVRISLGGVGRNIAHNLRLLEVPVEMLTALGDDLYARQAETDCAGLGIGLGRARRITGGRSSTYLAIEGPEGDMELALCDDDLTRSVTPEYLDENRALLNGAAAVAVDTNLTPEALAWLAEHCRAPIFADTVSMTKAERLRPLLGRLFLLKPNRLEAELLSGVPIRDRNSLELAAAKLLATGLRRVCISLGSEGVYCAWGTERCLAPCPPTELVNASGGGDAMMAGFLRAFLDGLPIEDAARFALACSSIAVEAEETVNPQLSLRAARQRTVGAVSQGISSGCQIEDMGRHLIGRPQNPAQAQSVGAVTGRPQNPAQAQSVGAVIGRPENPPTVGTRPNRKRNRLEAYDYSQGGAYHVVICTDGRKCILSEVYDAQDTQKLRLFPLGKLVEQAILAIPEHYPTVEIVRYSVMPNHVHLLLRLSTEKDNPAVPWVVNQLKGAVTRKSGIKVWQKGFYDQVIRTEADFRAIGEYIEYNPAKWKTDDYYVSPM